MTIATIYKSQTGEKSKECTGVSGLLDNVRR